MIVTVILSVIMMAGFFLMLVAAVAFIQDKKYFTSAPKEVQDVIQPKEERFRGQHVLGWILMIISVLLMAGPVFYAGFDGIRNGFAYWEFFLRFSVMFLMLKVFDILFFDWFLLCRSNFFPRYFPECKNVLGPQLFGFNKKSHALQILLFLIAAAALAGICMIFLR